MSATRGPAPSPIDGAGGSRSGAARWAALVCGCRAKWLVLVAWLVVVAVAVPLAGSLTGAQKNDSSTYLPARAESTKVLKLQRDFQPTNTIPAIVVYERRSGITTADQERAAADATAFGKVPGVAGSITGPITAKDHAALQVIVPVADGVGGWNEIAATVAKIKKITGGAPAGLLVRVTGPGGVVADTAVAFEGVDGTLLYATLAIVILVLLLTYRSPLLWLLPVVSAGVALVGSQAVAYLLARYAGVTVNGQSSGILTVLVFGAGTDYALLLVARYREELRRHVDRHEAMAAALRGAVPAIVASACTVAIGMLGLTFAEANSTKGMGPVAATGIVVALLAMITLLPATLVIFERWLFWPTVPNFGTTEPSGAGLWARVGRAIAARPRLVWMTTVALLGALAFGLTGLKADGLSTADQFVTRPDSVLGGEALAAHFPSSQGDPTVVIGRSAEATRLRDVVAATPGVADVAKPMVARDRVYLQATLVDPPDSKAAQATIVRIRAAVHRVAGGQAVVGGSTAIIVDTADAARHDRNLVIPLVLLVVLVILGLLLRSLVAPLALMATVVLSFASALGVSALVFEHVLGFAGADTSLPLFAFVFLVALGIDYNIFLMTRVREESLLAGTRRGVLAGLTTTGSVITSAGVVLAGTFAALATLPVVAFAEIGFTVALGVLLDTIIVRAVLVTALNLDIGRWIWWPSRLAARLDEPLDRSDTHDTPAAAPATDWVRR